MKKIKIIMMISVIGILSACGSKPVNTENLVLTSFFPIYDVTRNIASESLSIHNIAPLSMEVHDYEPSAKDLILLEEAKVLFVHGAHLEGWLDSTLKSINNPDLKVVVLSDSIELIDEDPHTWLSLLNMMTYANVIQDTLIEVFPSETLMIQENHQQWQMEAEALKSEHEDLFGAHQPGVLMVDHSAFTYLAEELSLTQTSITGGTLSSDLSAKKLKEIINTINTSHVKTIYQDEGSSQELFDILDEETSVTISKLHTLEQMNSKDYHSYLEMMAANYDAIAKGALYDSN